MENGLCSNLTREFCLQESFGLSLCSCLCLVVSVFYTSGEIFVKEIVQGVSKVILRRSHGAVLLGVVRVVKSLHSS